MSIVRSVLGGRPPRSRRGDGDIASRRTAAAVAVDMSDEDALLAAAPPHPAHGAPPSPASGGIPAWLIVGDSGTVPWLGLLDAFRMRRRRGQCLHCGRHLRHERLVEVRHVDEVSGCRPCALSLHNAGGGRLCPDHFHSHLQGRWTADPDAASRQACEFRQIL